MSATGWRYRSWNDTAKIGASAGAAITVFDDLLTNGDSPWTKTTNGTNDVTYQAPGGSQVKLRLYNNVAPTSCILARCTAQVPGGSPEDPVFPTSTQEATSQLGYCCFRQRFNSSGTSGYDPEWYGIRTDRYMVIVTGPSTTLPSSFNSIFACGDVPSFYATDPNFCIITGFCRNTNITTYTSNVSDQGIAGATMFNTWQGAGGTSVVGYTNLATNGSTYSPPLFAYSALPGGNCATVASHLSSIPLGRIVLATATNTTTQNFYGSTVTWRGHLPYVFASPVDVTAQANGDTFTDGNGNSYVFIKTTSSGAPNIYLMTSNTEALP